MGHEGGTRRRVRGSHRLAIIGTVVVMAAGSVLGAGLPASAATKTSEAASGLVVFGLDLGNVFGLFEHPKHTKKPAPNEDEGCMGHKKPPYDDNKPGQDCETHHHHHHHHHDKD